MKEMWLESENWGDDIRVTAVLDDGTERTAVAAYASEALALLLGLDPGKTNEEEDEMLEHLASLLEFRS